MSLLRSGLAGVELYVAEGLEKLRCWRTVSGAPKDGNLPSRGTIRSGGLGRRTMRLRAPSESKNAEGLRKTLVDRLTPLVEGAPI